MTPWAVLVNLIILLNVALLWLQKQLVLVNQSIGVCRREATLCARRNGKAVGRRSMVCHGEERCCVVVELGQLERKQSERGEGSGKTR